MRSIILFLFIFHNWAPIFAQSDPTYQQEKKFPIIYDSIPIKILKNYACEKGFEDFNNSQFEKSISEYNSALQLHPYDPLIFFNRALGYYKIQDRKSTCLDFKLSAYLGLQNAFKNYKTYCDSNSYTISFLDSGFVYTEKNKETPDVLPEFPGGIDSLYYFIINNLRKGSLKDYNFRENERILLKFIIDIDGSAVSPEYFQNSAFIEEIQLLFTIMPKWKPAIKNGSPVRCSYLFPIINEKAFTSAGSRFYNRGVKYFSDNKFEESVTSFDKAILFNLRDFEAYFNLGICCYKMNDLTNACLNLSQAFLINREKNTGELINKYCDSTISIKDEKNKIVSLGFTPNDKIYTEAEEMPSYPGGEQKLFEFLSMIRYPNKAKENKISGRVFVTFIVDENGNIKYPKILKGIGAGCDEEALRVVRLMPKWLPGKINGKNVMVQYNLPINFNLR